MAKPPRISYPLLEDGAWREAFPADWLAEGERVASSASFEVASVDVDSVGAVVVETELESGEHLTITIDLDELGMVQVEPISSEGRDPDYRDVIASLRHAETKAIPSAKPIAKAPKPMAPAKKAVSPAKPTSDDRPISKAEAAPNRTPEIVSPKATPALGTATPNAVTSWLVKLASGDASSETDPSSAVLYSLEQVTNAHSAHPVYGIVAYLREEGILGAFPLYDPDAVGQLGELDRSIIGRLSAIAELHVGRAVLPLSGEVGALLIGELLLSERCFLDGDFDGTAIRLAAPLDCSATWIPDDEGYQRPGFDPVDSATEIRGVLPSSPPHFIHSSGEAIGRILCDLPATVASMWLDAPEVDVEDAPEVRRAMDESGQGLPLPLEFEIEEIQGTILRPVLSLSDENVLSSSGCVEISGLDPCNLSVALVNFDYSGKRIRFGRDEDHIRYRKGGIVYYIPRLHEAEEAFAQKLISIGFSRLEDVVGGRTELRRKFHEAFTFQPNRKPDLQWRAFLDGHLDRLEQDDWIIEIDEFFSKMSVLPDNWYARIRESAEDGWFELECGVIVDGVEINLVRPLAKLAGSTASLTDIPKQAIELDHPGGQGKIRLEPHRLREVVGAVGELFDPGQQLQGDRLQLPELRAAELVAHEREALGLDDEPSERLKSLADRLKKVGSLNPADPEPGFTATLRPYQLEGFRWLQFLRETGLSGVLADDMGLGKTVQTLCHIHAEHRTGRSGGYPSIVVAPTSLVPNWAAEAEKFCPDLKVMRLEGPRRSKLYAFLGDVDIVITSYPILTRDYEILESQPFHLAVLDEAQQIKNPSSQSSRRVRQLTARHRICLSGTPVENNLGELWSMFCFLVPGLLGSREAFRRVYEHPIENDGNRERQQRLSRKLAPLMLRRTKETVATDLPSKTIVVHRVPLHRDQADLYNGMRTEMKSAFEDEDPSSMLIIEALLKLRQACCHPVLVNGSKTKTKGVRSAKLDHMLGLIDELSAAGRRILVFSQFTSMLDIIGAELKERSLSYCILTGSTKDRGEVVRRFQEGNDPVFLISLKAGGTGLNLTSADVVIHYDPWWNPAAEAQATDRAYRIGQKNPVFVYKLIAEGTVEERILALQEKKAALADGLLGRGDGGGAFKVADIDIDLLLSPVGAEREGA